MKVFYKPTKEFTLVMNEEEYVSLIGALCSVRNGVTPTSRDKDFAIQFAATSTTE